MTRPYMALKIWLSSPYYQFFTSTTTPTCYIPSASNHCRYLKGAVFSHFFSVLENPLPLGGHWALSHLLEASSLKPPLIPVMCFPYILCIPGIQGLAHYICSKWFPPPSPPHLCSPEESPCPHSPLLSPNPWSRIDIQ